MVANRERSLIVPLAIPISLEAAEAELHERLRNFAVSRANLRRYARGPVFLSTRTLYGYEAFEWRRCTWRALEVLDFRIGFLRLWIHERKTARFLDSLCELGKTLENEGVELDPPELALIDDARRHLARR